MHELQPLERQEPQPQERRHGIRLALVLRPSLDDLQERLLDHVRRVDPAAQPLIEPQGHHAPQAVAMGREELAPVHAIGSERKNPSATHAISRVFLHLVGIHKNLDCARLPTLGRNRLSVLLGQGYILNGTARGRPFGTGKSTTIKTPTKQLMLARLCALNAWIRREGRRGVVKSWG